MSQQRGMYAVLVCALLLPTVWCSDIKMKDLPADVSEQLSYIRNSLTSNLQAKCNRVPEFKIDFHLYSRNDYQNGVILDPNEPNEIESDKKLVLLIHGWIFSSNSSEVLQLKNAYLDRYDCNVIIVDWSRVSLKPYTTAFCYVPKISHYVSQFLCTLRKTWGVSLDKLHVVGHSMGAHIAGMLGSYVKLKCKQEIGRITGLDPSGPLFQHLPERRRLDKSDAAFVDVIHTDQMNLGFSGNCGHVDFHPNCGQIQPGCRALRNISAETSVSDVVCSHRRSLEYMTESISSDQFVAVACSMCPRYCRPNIINGMYFIMGENCQQGFHAANKFFLNTHPSPPYAQGWSISNAKLP